MTEEDREIIMEESFKIRIKEYIRIRRLKKKLEKKKERRREEREENVWCQIIQ